MMDAELDAECICILRETAKECLGGNCTFADDDIKLLGILARRAVMAGLHMDVKNEKTRSNMEKAAETKRAETETSLGFKITRQMG